MKKQSIFLTLVLIVIVLLVTLLMRTSDGPIINGDPSLVIGPLAQGEFAQVGQPAPNFQLKDYNGELHKLSDYRGMPLVLNFWATWCPFCVDELPDFQEVFDELHTGQPGSLDIIAVNRGETLDQAKRFTDPMGLEYTVLLNSKDDVSKTYLVAAMPTTYFIDSNGVIVDIVRGPLEKDTLLAKVEELFNLSPDAPEQVLETFTEPVIADIAQSPIQSKRAVLETEGVKHSVPLNDIKGGGPAKDGIPSIDDPKFESIAKAASWMQEQDFGIAVSFGGENRFYPNRILNWHEIVNDTVGGQPALITFCPLCGTGIVFEPIVKGKQTEFGTSGKLWNSNLIMYDRQTDSYWSQVLGESVVGEMTGTKLNLLAHKNISYSDFKELYPKGEVLSRTTGFIRDYSRSPYGNYEENTSIFFPVDKEDDRYHPKSIAFGIEINGEAKAYPLEELEKGTISFNDIVGGVGLKVEFDNEFKTLAIRRSANGQEVIPVYGFWFSWVAAHPNTDVYITS